jgi:hypothetical protein
MVKKQLLHDGEKQLSEERQFWITFWVRTPLHLLLYDNQRKLIIRNNHQVCVVERDYFFPLFICLPLMMFFHDEKIHQKL